MQQELVERARRGDHDAFAALAGAALFRLDAAARLILRDPDQAKDAVQETLVRAWRDLPTLRSPDRFDAWLHRLLVRACIDEARRLRRHRVDVELTPIDAPAVDDGVSVTNDRDQLERGFSRLEPEARALDRPSPLSRPAFAGGRHRARDPARDGEIAPAPSTRVHASCARRRCPTSVGDHGGPSGMTLNDGFERTVSDWLDEQAGHGMPGYLDEALARTTRTRQRPAWSSLERWLPVDMTTNLRIAARPTLGRVLLLGAVLAALIGLALIAVGSRNPRVPAPFGLAANGQIAYWADGDILVADPDGTHAHAVISGPSDDFAAVYTRDGTQLAFLRMVSHGSPRSNADDRRPGRIGGSAGLEGAPDRRYLVRLVAG